MIYINYSEIEPILRSFGDGVWEQFCHDVIEAMEKLNESTT